MWVGGCKCEWVVGRVCVRVCGWEGGVGGLLTVIDYNQASEAPKFSNEDVHVPLSVFISQKYTHNNLYMYIWLGR